MQTPGIYLIRPRIDLDKLPPIPEEEMQRRRRAALRLKERRSSHPYYGRRVAEARARGEHEAEMEYWLNLQGSAVLAD
jgi:hypothetical protein